MARAREDSGVAPTRLSLPKGPGSLGGIGENARPLASMGLLGYGVDIAVPAGYPGLTPELRLAYSSGNGNGIAGIGWDLAGPSIERMTSQGVPRYTAADRFAADGGTELVRVATHGTSATYRARFEGGFVRYTWIDRLPSGAAGTGADGYWKAEYPDGTIGYFGARADGTPVDTAAIRGTKGTFRYLLTERVDPAGRHILYAYQRDGVRLLLRRISYVFAADATPRYEVVLGYDDRPDVLSDGRPGFNLRTTKRLSTIDVTARGEALRGYRLAYEPVSLSGGLSRLQSVTTLGRHGEVSPVRFAFQYSASLPAGCAAGSACGATVTTVPESLGVDPRDGSLELVDLDGDALPDVLSTRGGAHTFWFNRPAAGGQAHFSAPALSQVGHGDLGSGRAELLDVNGDGFTDLLDAATGTVLFNRGSSDWLVNQQFQLSGLPDLAGANLRFLDYNDDKRIDLVQSSADSTTFWENLGNGQFALAPGGTPLGTGFDEGAASLADLNGDGLLDVVRVVGGNVQVRLDLGLGSFTAWQGAGAISEQYPGEARFADLNGDGLADAVIVRAGTVRVALNRNGQGFDAPRVWTSSTALPFPTGSDDNLVRFADMDGNGSTDLVWIDASGKVTYLDLFATRPNLLTRISNGIGQVIVAEYGSSSEHARRDGATTPPAYRLPGVIATLDRLSRHDTLSGVRKVETFHYKDGYYDGREKQFRGFTTVEVTTDAGTNVEAGFVTTHYDVGVDDPARRGLVLDESTTSAGRAIDATSTSYVACPIAGVDAQVRFICPDRLVRTIKEGAAAAQVRTEEDYGYDRYGHRVRTLELGVVGQSGDERLEELTYVSPETNGGRWRLDLRATRRESFSESGANARVETYHYDGDAFVGLPAGEATNGWLSRTETTTDDAGHTIDALRQRLDEHGAVVEALDANGHRRRFGYDDDGLQVREETVVLDDPGHAVYGLRASVVYDPVQDVVIESHPWVRTDRPEAAPGADDARRTLYAWDGLGRLTAIVRPGDTLALPSEDFSYDLGDPVSRIVHRRRSVAGAASADLEEVQCFDGLGRALETRTRVDANRFQVSGFAALNGLDQPRFQTLPFFGEGDACDRLAPAGTHARRLRYDARGRLLETVQPDASLFGSASRVQVSYTPLATTTLDEEASATGPHAGAARVTRQDGLGRVIAVERGLAATASAPAATLVTRFGYDAHGQLARREDPMGNVSTHHFDALGHLLGIEDPDAGTISFSLDALGNPLGRTDARGRTVESRYDAAGRLVARWDDAAPEASRVSFEYDVDPCVAGVCGRGDGELGRIVYPLGDDRRGEDRLVRDVRGRAIWNARSLDGREVVLGSEYDDADRTTARIYPGGRRVAFGLDGAGRVAAIPGIVDAVDYSAAGALASITRPGGFVTRYGYDAVDRLSSIDSRATDVLQAYQFTRDRAGNLVHVDDTTPLAADLPSLAADYELDSLYRLTEARLDTGRAAEETLDFSYDAADDPLSRTSSRGGASPEHLGSFVYGGGGAGPHAVTAAGGLAFGYDAAGHMTRRGDVELVWDSDEHLAEVRRGPETLARFAYDAFGKRVEKSEAGHVTTYLAPDYELHDGADEILVAIAGRQVARLESRRQHVAGAEDVDGDGRIDASDAWLVLALRAGLVQRDVDISHADPARILAASARALLVGDGDSVETLTYPLTDAVGTVVATADAHGAILERTWRYPFGGERARSTDTDEERGFVGSELDRSSGLSYFGARYLDARLGRWAAVDPLVVGRLDLCRDQPGECNLYGYAQDNPLTHVDPTGMYSSKDLGPFAMPVHQMAVQRVLGGRVDGWAIQAMCDAQTHIDMFQGNQDQHLHALVGKGVKRDVAISRSNQVVRDKIEEAIAAYQQGNEYDAWEALGWAIHVLQDSTSPKHEGFQGWDDKAGWRAEVRHGWGERNYPTGEGARRLEGATLYVYDLFKQGMTEPDRTYLEETTFFQAGSGKLMLPEKYLAPITPGKEQSE